MRSTTPTQRSAPPRTHLHALMLLWALMVATSFPVAAAVNPELSPFMLTAVRFFVASLLLLPWLWWRREWHWPTWPQAFAYGLLGLCLAGFFSAMFYALRTSSPIVTAALFVTQPLFAFGLGMLLRVEHWRWRTLGTLLLGAAGALVIVASRARGQQGWHLGQAELIFLAGCACSAGYAVGSRYLTDRGAIVRSPLLTTFWSLLLGAAAIGAPALGGWPAFADAFGWRDAAVVVYLAVFTTCVTFWIQLYVTLSMPPSTVAAYGYLSPLMVLLIQAVGNPAVLAALQIPGALLLLLTWLLLLRT